MLPLAVTNGDVIIIVVLLVVPIAAIAFAGAGSVYREIGKGAFAMDHEKKASGDADLSSSIGRAEQQVEIRQMLEAKAYRQRQRGEEPIDVDEELQRANAPQPIDLNADPALVAEVRDLVIARNKRRMRHDKDPLDVETEVARQLRDLEDLGT